MLGKKQWLWLENELKVNADVRIIGSSTQFGIEWNGYESWENFPNEKQKMIDLIKNTKANNVFFISGDVHYSEISKVETDFYPLFDFTSSGLSSTWHFATPNKNRIEGPVMDNHFGLITIDFTDSKNEFVKFENWDIHDNQRFEYTIDLKNIDFKETRMKLILNKVYLVLYPLLFYHHNLYSQCNGRYQDEIFNSISVNTVYYSDVYFDNNHKMDIYTPDNDTLTERPVVIYLFGGALLLDLKTIQIV